MDFSAYKNKRVAVLFLGEYANLPSGLASWAISDLDAYFDNLDMWTDPKSEFLATFFSQPIPGLRQHLGEYRQPNVGVAGTTLSEMIGIIKKFYLEHGYDVIELSPGKVNNYTQCPQIGKVRIILS